MPKSIDQRIVNMKFNNAQFERGVKTTMNSVKKLEESLKFEGAVKSIDKLEKTANNVDLSGMAKAVDSINNKFSAFGVAAATVIQDITRSALNFGKRITSALTVDPVLDGLDEYELKMNSIQTILTNTASKGTTLDQVNDALEQLNKYADKTIYNFAQMTDNVGKFTAAGLGLEDSVVNIKGLSNLAAGTGVDNTRMVGAAQQIAQALQNPFFIAQDWYSISNANLGGELLQSGLKETAANMGIVVEEGVAFKETLKDGWLTAEVWTETMRKMAEDPALLRAAQNVTTFTKLIDTLKEAMGSGWAGTWEAILGGKEQSTALWTGISNALGDIIGQEAEARNELFKFWNEQGGREDVLIGIGNILMNIANILEPIEQAFGAVFKPITGELLVSASKKFRQLMESFKIGEGTSDALRRTFTGLFSIVNIILKTFKIAGKVFMAFLGAVLPVGDGLLGITALLGDIFTSLDKGVFVVDSIVEGFQKALEFISPITNKIVELLGFLAGGVAYFASQIDLDAIKNEFLYLKNQLSPIVKTLKNDLEYLMGKISFDGLKQGLIDAKNVIYDFVFGGYDLSAMFKQLGTDILAYLQNVKSFLAPVEKVAGFIYMIFVKLGQGIQFVWGKIVGFVNTIKQGFKDVGNNFSEGTTSVFDSLKAALDYLDWDKIEKLLKGSLLASIILVFRKFLNSISNFLNGGGSIFGPIVEVLESVKDTLETYQNVLKANILLKIAGAVAILTISLIALSSIDADKLKQALIAMGFLVGYLVGSFKLMNKIIDSDAFVDTAKAVTAMVGMSAAILLLSIAIKKLGALDVADVVQGTLAIGGLMTAIVFLTKYLDKNIVQISKSMGSLIVFGIAINVLVSAVKRLSNLSWDEALIGLGGVIGLMAGIVGMLKYSKADTVTIQAAASILIISLAISRLTGVVGSLGRLKPEELYRGLAGVLTLLGAISAFMFGLNKIGDVTKSSLVILSISTSMVIVAYALEKIGTMEWIELAKGVSAMTATLGLFVGAMKLISKFSINVDSALVILAMTGSMLAIGFALEKLASLTWQQIGVGLGVMTASLAILVAAMQYMKNPVSAAAGGAMLLMTGSMIVAGFALEKLGNLSWLQIGKGLTAMLGAIAILTIATMKAQAALPGAGAMLIMAGVMWLMVPPLLALSAVPMKGVGAGLLLLAGAITVIGLASVLLVEAIPAMLGLGGAVALIGLGVGVASAGLAALAFGIVALAGALFTAGISFTFFVEDLLPLLPKIVSGIADGMIVGIQKLREALPEIGLTIIAGIEMIANVISETGGIVVEAILDLILNILHAIDDRLPEFLEVGFSILKNLGKGILDNISVIVQIGIDLILGFIKGARTKIPGVLEEGAQFIIDLINGMAETIREKKDDLYKAFVNVLSAVIGIDQETIDGWIKDFVKLGGDLLNGLVKGIGAAPGKLKAAVKNEIDYLKNIFTNKEDGFDTNSPSKWFESLGIFLMEGLTKGIDGGADGTANSVKDIVSGVKKDATGVAGSVGAAAKDAFEKAVAWIEERKFYNLLSLQEELDEWLNLQKIYGEGSEERKRIDREVYTLTNKLAEETFNNQVKLIKDKKYFDQLALSEELAAWRNVQKEYLGAEKNHVKAAEEREKAAKEIYRIEKEIAKLTEKYQDKALDAQAKANEDRISLEEEYAAKTSAINDKLMDDIDQLAYEYESAIDSRTDALYRAYGLFDKAELKDPVEGDDLISNLESQVDILNLWRKQINLLQARGVDLGLIEELQNMGPSAVQEIRALNKLSESDLNKYVDLWRDKHAEAKGRAIFELQDMRNDTIGEINILTEEAKNGLDEYNRVWAGRLLALARDSKAALIEIRADYTEQIGSMPSELEQAVINSIDKAIEVIDSPNWSQSGSDVINGIVSGATDSQKILFDKMKYLATTSLSGFKDPLGIESPSKEFAKLGEYCIDGLIKGMKNYTEKLITETESVGKIVKDALKEVFDVVAYQVSTEMEFQPTIRPVIDMSNVKAGMASVFGQNGSINVSGITSRASQISDDVNATTNTISQNEINITNNYTVRNDSDIRRISVDLKNTLDRFNYAKGVIVK